MGKKAKKHTNLASKKRRPSTGSLAALAPKAKPNAFETIAPKRKFDILGRRYAAIHCRSVSTPTAARPDADGNQRRPRGTRARVIPSSDARTGVVTALSHFGTAAAARCRRHHTAQWVWRRRRRRTTGGRSCGWRWCRPHAAVVDTARSFRCSSHCAARSALPGFHMPCCGVPDRLPVGGCSVL